MGKKKKDNITIKKTTAVGTSEQMLNNVNQEEELTACKDACEVEIEPSWIIYVNPKDKSGFVTIKPHFGNYKDWLKACDEIGNENTVQFFVCEECMGIFVHEQPFRCERCGNWDEHKFKEITGEMRAEMEAGRTLDDIIKSYCYT